MLALAANQLPAFIAQVVLRCLLSRQIFVDSDVKKTAYWMVGFTVMTTTWVFGLVMHLIASKFDSEMSGNEQEPAERPL